MSVIHICPVCQIRLGIEISPAYFDSRQEYEAHLAKIAAKIVSHRCHQAEELEATSEGKEKCHALSARKDRLWSES